MKSLPTENTLKSRTQGNHKYYKSWYQEKPDDQTFNQMTGTTQTAL